jgi:hypothetical protein
MRQIALAGVAAMLRGIVLGHVTDARQMVFPGEDWERATPRQNIVAGS